MDKWPIPDKAHFRQSRQAIYSDIQDYVPNTVTYQHGCVFNEECNFLLFPNFTVSLHWSTRVISLDQSRWGEERGLWCTQLSWCFLINLDPIYKQGKAIQKQVWGSDRNVMKSKGSILRTVSHSAFWCPFVEGLAASESLALCERWSLSKPAKQQKHSMYTGFKDMAEACRKQGKQWCKQNFLLPTKN